MKELFTLGVAAGLGLAAFHCHAYGTNQTIRNAAGNDQYCLDANLDQKERNGNPVTVYKCHGHNNQRWAITHNENNQSAIASLGGFCLDVKGAHSKATGTPVELWRCHFRSKQLFQVLPSGQLKEVESGKCLMALNEKDRAPGT